METQIICRKCSIILTEENKVKKEKICKSCNKIKHNEWRIRKANNEPPIVKQVTNCSKCLKELTDDNRIKHRTICKDCRSNNYSEYVKNNKEKVCENRKEYYDKNKEKFSDYYKNHYKENKDTYMENNRKWREENREKINMKANEKSALDPTIRLIKACRTRINIALKNSSNKSTLKLIDCNIDFLKEWLSYNFQDGMTMDNYGSYWHVDHVIPCSLFDLTNQDEVNDCFK